MTPELVIALLSSSLLSGVLGAAIAGAFSLRSKSNDYENEYFKIVLQRRVEAYSELEKLVVMIKMAVLDNKDRRLYHLLFAGEESESDIYQTLFRIMSHSLWFSDELFDKTRELNLLIFKHNGEYKSLVEFGKDHYERIAALRTSIEILHARDMLSLHKVPKFLQSKKPDHGFSSIEGRG